MTDYSSAFVELETAEFQRVRPLFRPLEGHLFCAAVVAGGQAGRVFVDDPADPQSAFLVTRGAWGYLAGRPDNEPFNRALNRALMSRMAVEREVPLLQLTCHPQAWHGHLRAITRPSRPVAELRHVYLAREMVFDRQAALPAGYRVERIGRWLLERPETELPEDVLRVIEGEAAGPLGDGFGFVALHEGRVVAHAVVDCIVGPAGDMGLFTDEAHRRRGLATVTSTATIEYGLEHGLSQVVWDCAEGNAGSIRTAEKLGLLRDHDYTMHWFLFD